MLMTDGHRAAPIDHDALRADVQRARELYTRQARTAIVTDTVEALRAHLTSLIPACEDVAGRMPEGRSQSRLRSAIATARHLMTAAPATGPMGQLVRMQLLADSVAVLAALVRTLPEEPL